MYCSKPKMFSCWSPLACCIHYLHMYVQYTICIHTHYMHSSLFIDRFAFIIEEFWQPLNFHMTLLNYFILFYQHLVSDILDINRKLFSQIVQLQLQSLLICSISRSNIALLQLDGYLLFIYCLRIKKKGPIRFNDTKPMSDNCRNDNAEFFFWAKRGIRLIRQSLTNNNESTLGTRVRSRQEIPARLAQNLHKFQRAAFNRLNFSRTRTPLKPLKIHL